MMNLSDLEITAPINRTLQKLLIQFLFDYFVIVFY